MGSRARYLIVLAEGGSADGRAVYNRPLADGTLTIGRSSVAEIRMPAQESAIGQHHCRLRVEDNVVWLDTIDHQEVYLDPDAAPSPDESRVLESTKLLPSERSEGRLLELGGLSRSAPRAGGKPTGFGQTRLRVMLGDGPKPAVETPQAAASKKSRNALELFMVVWRIGIFVMVAGGIAAAVYWGPPAYAAVMREVARANTGIETANEGITSIQQQLSDQERQLSGYYGQLMETMGRRYEQTLDILNALPNELRTPPPPPPHYPVSEKSVWLAGYVDASSRRFEPVATVWVLAGEGHDGRRSLITNKHVVDALGAHAGDGDLAVRRIGADRQTVTLLVDESNLEVHPGFQRFSDFRLQAGRRPGGVNVFDIGRLVLADEGGDALLGAGLQLAERNELEGLKAGDQIDYIGYPYENLSDGGVNPERPQTMLLRGRIVRISDALLQDADGADGQLIVVDAPAMGGASGSPVFNAAGRVIGLLSGGDVLEFQSADVLTEATRVSAQVGVSRDKFRMPVGFSYVIRSDAAGEIARRAFTDRTPQWTRLVNAAAPDESAALKEWKKTRCGGRQLQPHSTSLRLDADGRYETAFNPVQAGESRFYSVAAAEDRPSIFGIERLARAGAPAVSGGVAVLRYESFFNFRSSDPVRVVVSGVPGARIAVDEYVCPLSPPWDASTGAVP